MNRRVLLAAATSLLFSTQAGAAASCDALVASFGDRLAEAP